MDPKIAGVLKPLLDSRDPETRTRVSYILSGWAMPYFIKKFREEKR